MIIVVARYNENVEWCEQLENVLIYNKGKELKDTKHNVIVLKNVGREGHTYYKHIYDNYEDLDDYTIFLQGKPSDHSKYIIHSIQKIQQSYNTNKNLNINFEFLSERVEYCSLSGCRFHSGLNLKETYKIIFGKDGENNNFQFSPGAQFIVSRDQILKRPKEFYLKIIKLLEYDVNPIEGYVVERFHKLIFS